MWEGLRVIQTGDSCFRDQGGGECHAGTIVKPDLLGDWKLHKTMLFIAWDCGTVANYLADTLHFDLRVFDNAPTGIRHVFVTCDGCGESGIKGLRWHCTDCPDYDLCSQCYMDDKHFLEHNFVRYDTPTSVGAVVPLRNSSTKKCIYGIFMGARVVRGVDWKWGNQDGGSGTEGCVCEVHGRDDSFRSVVDVRWNNGKINRYRLGLEGKADVQATESVIGGHYYIDHLPQLSQYGKSPGGLQTGDLVKVTVSAEKLPEFMEHSDMAENSSMYTKKIGKVVTVKNDVNVGVYFSFCKKLVFVHHSALVKLPRIKVGDIVTISNSLELVKRLQDGHGGWVSGMKKILGRRGKVIHIFDTGDLRVSVGNRGTWTLNQECCTLEDTSCNTSVMIAVDSATDEDACTESSDDEEETVFSDLGRDLLRRLLEEHGQVKAKRIEFDPLNLVHLADRGNPAAVAQLLDRFPEKVNVPSEGRYALHVAAAKGHEEVVRMLLLAGADVSATDDDGDSVFHYVVYGEKSELFELLMNSGANVNARNKKGRTPLHIAVCKSSTNCVASLLGLGGSIDINQQDTDGDTALHDAVFHGSNEVIDMILENENVNFEITNKKTFNVLHHAVFKGNVYAVQKLLERPQCCALVNVGTSDAQTCLHIAAVNGYREIAQLLLQKGKADINAYNKHMHTPLMLALSEGRAAVIELLVSRGADVKLADENGVTALHIALSDHAKFDFDLKFRMRQTTPREFDQAPAIAKINLDLPPSWPNRQWLAIACYLVEHGADLECVDSRGNTPLTHVKRSDVAETLRKYAPSTSAKECMMCAEAVVAVLFEPCGHRIVCAECSLRMKKCFFCHEPISAKVPLEPDTKKPKTSAAGSQSGTKANVNQSHNSASAFSSSASRKSLSSESRKHPTDDKCVLS